MTEAAIQGVIFDLDGTLYTLVAPKLRMTFALAADLKLLRRLSAARKSLRGQSFGDTVALRTALSSRLSQMCGLPASRVLVWYEERFYPAFVEMLRESGTSRPGLDALLLRLRLRGVRIAVYSDYDMIGARLGALGLRLEDFDDLVSAEAFGVVKPSSEPIKALLQKWGLPAKRVVMVGDREDLDAPSAAQCGLHYYGLGTFPSSLVGPRSWHSVMKRLDLATQGFRREP
ncbi:MAG: HAD family hydrolase [Myxococcota bacterium]|jgi:HAD superfamily hydrolase (TIGR01549 family)|nr:HAD family hydrolase [Myxococcota bacterium]